LRCIIQENDLEIGVGLVQDTFHPLPEKAAIIVIGDNHADPNHDSVLAVWSFPTTHRRLVLFAIDCRGKYLIQAYRSSATVADIIQH
jgi:hypothetical protein